MELRVIKYNHKDCPMYVTAMSGKKVAEISDVDSSDKDPNGYQRERSKARCAVIKGYIEQTGGLIPGAILANVRSEKVDQLKYSKLGEQDGVEFGTIDIPDEKFLWIMDGQHRVGAFETLEEDIFIPVVIAEGLARAKEGETFDVVNSNQKNVSASLNFYDMMRFAGEDVKQWTSKLGKEADEAAYRIVLDANQDGPWAGRINLTGARGMKRAIALKGFKDALDPVVTDRSFATMTSENQVNLMQTFWQAVGKVWPTALADSTSVLNKTFGVHVACGVAIDVFHYSEQLGDSSVEGMARLLEPVKAIVGDWSPEGSLRAYIGGGRRNVRFVIDSLRTRIRNQFEELRQKAPAQPA